MAPKRTRSIVGLGAIALIAVGCSTAGPTDRPAVPSSSGAASASTAAASPTAVPSPSLVASVSVTPESPSAVPTSVDSAPSGEPLTGTAGPGCGTGQLGFFTHRDEVPDTLHFGGATIEFTIALIGLRNGTYTADDAIPGAIGLSRTELAVRVDPGTRILLRGDGLTLTDVTARSASWAEVDFAGGLASLPEGGDELPWRTRGDGSISVSAPSAPGDYVVEFLPRWHSECLHGDGTAYGRIKVNG